MHQSARKGHGKGNGSFLIPLTSQSLSGRDLFFIFPLILRYFESILMTMTKVGVDSIVLLLLSLLFLVRIRLKDDVRLFSHRHIDRPPVTRNNRVDGKSKKESSIPLWESDAIMLPEQSKRCEFGHYYPVHSS